MDTDNTILTGDVYAHVGRDRPLFPSPPRPRRPHGKEGAVFSRTTNIMPHLLSSRVRGIRPRFVRGAHTRGTQTVPYCCIVQPVGKSACEVTPKF
jgi:hypothetical protein